MAFFYFIRAMGVLDAIGGLLVCWMCFEAARDAALRRDLEDRALMGTVFLPFVRVMGVVVPVAGLFVCWMCFQSARGAR